MSTITVNSFTIPNYRGGGASATIRVYADQKFQTSDGTQILKSKPGSAVWYKSIACTVSGTVITVPEFTIDSTTDSNVPDGSFTAAIFDANGLFKDIFFKHYMIPHDMGSPIAFSVIVDYQEDPPPANAGSYYTRSQVDAAIGAVISDATYNEATWNGDTSHVSTKNAVRDKFESISDDIEAIGVAANAYTDSEVADALVTAGAYADGKVSDTAYNATSWNSVTTIAPSKNAVRDIIESLITSIASAASAAASALMRSNHTGTQPASTISDFDAAALLAAPAETGVSMGALIHSTITSKGTPVDADEFGGTDSAASYVLKRFTWANIKATLLAYFNTKYPQPLFNRFADVTTATMFEETLYTDQIAAGRFVTNGDKVTVEYAGSFAANGNAKFLSFTFNGVTLFASVPIVDNNTGWKLSATFIRVSNTILRCVCNLSTANASPPEYFELTGLNLTTTAYDIALLGETGSAAGDLTARMATGVYIPAA